jgi:hypothetical protein
MTKPTSRSDIPPHIPHFPISPKEGILLAIAIVALAAIAIGLSGIIPKGFTSLGMPGSIILLAAGTLTLIVVVAIRCFSPWFRPESDSDSSSESEDSTFDSDSSPPPDVTRKQLMTKLSAQGSKLEFIKPDELNFWDYANKNDNERPPSIVRKSWDDEGTRLYNNQRQLLLATDQQILGLKLSTIEHFAPEEWAFLLFRIAEMEREETSPVVPNKSWDESMGDPTLAELRAFQCTPDLISGLHRIFLPLLSAQQLEALFKEQEDLIANELLYDLLPFELPEEEKYTAQKLNALSNESVLRHVANFHPEQIHLLPVHYFEEEGIPWETVLGEEDDTRILERVLRRDIHHIAKTQAIVQVFSQKVINPLSVLMHVEILPLFKHSQIEDPEFPWSEFIAKEGIGFQMQKVYKSLPKAKIPWERFVENQDEVFNLFPNSAQAKDINTYILRNLDYPILKILAPVLPVWVIPLFSVEQLQHAHFPWSAFVQKDQIGLYLAQETKEHADERSKKWVPAEVATFSIPWKKFARYPHEMKSLFSLAIADQKRTKSLLNSLIIKAIKNLAPTLQAEHILLFEEKQLLDPDFPWSRFLMKKNIELNMHKWKPEILIQQLKRRDFPWETFIQKPNLGKLMHQWSARVLAEAPIPWEEFAKRIGEVYELFVQSAVTNEQTTAILQGLGFPALQALAPVLSESLISYFSVQQLQNPQFPWASFLAKNQIGYHLADATKQNTYERSNKWDPAYVANFSIPWATFAHYPNEMNRLFCLDKEDKERTENLLKCLPVGSIQKAAPALRAEHILLFDEKQRKDPGFPWPSFFNKEGIENTMYKWEPEVLLQQLQSKDFPWDTFIQKPKIGELMHQWPTSVLTQAPIPWQVLATRNDQVDRLFERCAMTNQKTTTILQNLGYEALEALAPALSDELISYFSIPQLQNPVFPWGHFLAKGQIGYQLTKWKANVAQFSIPWKEFARYPNQIANLFNLYYKEQTEILTHLPLATIIEIAPALTVKHIPFCKPEHRQDPSFPHDLFKKN